MTYDDVADIKAMLVAITALLERMAETLDAIERDTTVLAFPLREAYRRGSGEPPGEPWP